MLRAIGYARKSKEDTDKESPLDYQIAAIKKFAKANGYRLVDIETDNGISAKNLKNRPGAQRVLKLIEDRLIDAVIVYRSDRLCRNTLESLQVKNLFIEKKVAYYSVEQGLLSESNADADFMSTLYSAMDERERKLVSERMKSKLARMKEKGLRIGGQPRYGQKVVNKEIVENTAEKILLKRVLDLRSQGQSIRRIVDIVNSEGFMTRKQTPFGRNQIHRILKTA
ncbi:MAG: recombinase family protein [Desulfomonilaceae bacterium]